MQNGDYDALILSLGGVERLGLDVDFSVLSKSSFVPSANQGVVAVVAREDSEVFEELWRFDDRKTRVEVTAERIILDEIGGGCIAPMGVRADLVGEDIDIITEVLSLDGDEVIRVQDRFQVESYVEGAERLADEMIERGAKEVIERVSSEVEDE